LNHSKGSNQDLIDFMKREIAGQTNDQDQENEAELNELRAELLFQRMNHKLEKPYDAYPLRVAELADFQLANRVFSSCGPFGIVHGVHTNWTRLEKRINIPIESERRCWDIVALKMMFNFNYPQADLVDEQKNRFDQEYFLPLTHPHWSIIQVFNYFRSDMIPDLLPDQGAQHRMYSLFATRTTYFTMEAGQGTLEQFLRKSKIMDWKSGLMIVVQILWGVQHISSLGFAHMNLKLDNIIWLFNKRPSIEGHQFVIGGFACVSPGHVQGDAILGNPRNLAPEILRHRNGQVNVIFNDIWAVGCILFQIFYNHPFFFGDPNVLESRIYDLNLPCLDQKWGLGCAKLLELMWKRNGK
jgi:serine/threonine protein kinase